MARGADKRIPSEDILGEEDWQVLTELFGVLHAVWRLTKRFEGNYLRFHEIISQVHLLRDKLEGFLHYYADGQVAHPARLTRISLDEIPIEKEQPTSERVEVAQLTSPQRRLSNSSSPLSSPLSTPSCSSSPLPHLPSIQDTPSRERPCRIIRLPNRLADYEVDMPITRRSCPQPTSSPSENTQTSNTPRNIIDINVDLCYG